MVKKIITIETDEQAMDYAYKQALKAYDAREVPIGAIAVDKDGKIIAVAYNQVEKKGSQLAHAELEVLAKVVKKLKRWRLNDLTIYVTLQPCVMCMGALILSRVEKIVYGAKSPLFGCDLDKLDWFGVYKDTLPSVHFQEHVESIHLLKKFFIEQRRIKNGS